MIKPAEAKKQLKQWRVDDSDRIETDAVYAPAIKKLPAKLRTIGYRLVGLNSKGEDEDDWNDWTERDAVIRKQKRDMDALSAADRKKLFRVFFHKLADDVERAWQWLKGSTYTRSYNETVFRAPKNPEATLERRWSWLVDMTRVACQFKPEILTSQWLAAWVPYMAEDVWDSHEEEVGILLAAVIDKGTKKTADEVFEILCASAKKEHEVGAMGTHVATALLGAGRAEGWELMERMLLAAKRQEGLRQVILGTVATSHPEAFRRMIGVVVDEKLSRFSSIIYSINQWFGMKWAAGGNRTVHDYLTRASLFLNKPAERKKALAGNDAESAYLALWATAFDDAPGSLKPAEKLLKHENPEFRFVAALHLNMIGLSAAGPLLIRAIDDEDPRVALVAMEGPCYDEDFDGVDLENTADRFEAIERLVERAPAKKTKLKPIVWPWTEMSIHAREVGDTLVHALGNLKPTRLIPHLQSLDTWERSSVVTQLAEQKTWDKLTRETILKLAGDKSGTVCESAIDALKKVKLRPAEVEQLETYLTRTSIDVRKGVVKLILKLKDKDALASAVRLAGSGQKNQRLAGLEVMRQLAESDRDRASCISAATEWNQSRKRVLKNEQIQLDAILASDREVLTLENALGLLDPAKRSPRVEPKNRKARCMTATVPKLLKALDDLVHEHRNETITYEAWNGKTTSPLGEVEWGFPYPDFDKPAARQRRDLPLCEVWEDWYLNRKASLRDADGFELIRTEIALDASDQWSDNFEEVRDWAKGKKDRKPLMTLLCGDFKLPKLRYQELVERLLPWLLVLQPPKGAVGFALDVRETIYATVPESAHQLLLAEYDEDDYSNDPDKDWRRLSLIQTWIQQADRLRYRREKRASATDRKRMWQLAHWADEPILGAKRYRPDLTTLAAAVQSKHANIHDLTDSLLGPRGEHDWSPFEALNQLTQRRVERELRAFASRADVEKLVNRIRERLFEIELARGDTPTAGTDASLAVRTWYGTDKLLALLNALGKDGFKKPRGWNSRARDSRAATLTEMVGRTFPHKDDRAADFSKAVHQAIRDGVYDDERLLQLSFLAPQWIRFVADALGWEGYEEATYWFMAHMSHWGIGEGLEDDGEDDEDMELDDDADSDDGDEEEKPRKLSRWERIIRERTSLTSDERREGAIDVAWFHRTFSMIKAAKFDRLAAAAKFAATPQQAKRAQFIADVLLKKIRKKELVDGIRKKNLKEYVRLLGLLPLEGGARENKDLLDRYEVLQEYRRYANGLSSMSKPDALRACEIGMQNLAATAGYADPMRLQWTLEAESTKDLAEGPVQISKGDVSLTLSLDAEASPELTIRRGEKTLKSLPKTVNKDKKFVALRDRHKHLKRQASRVRASLETAMIRGDSFSGAELQQLADHAILWPQLARLVLVGDGIAGYPVKRGKALQSHSGKLEPVKKAEQIRIAHPHDLLKSKQWSKWQQECFNTERLQPFKQVFRELYVPSAQEKKDKTFSSRYAGQQVNPRQSYALWGRRAWSVDEYGDVFKAFPDENLTVSVSFNDGLTTPLEVEGLTIEAVHFRRRDEAKPLPLTKVPPRLFSEVMRDMDLVVSVAHVGEVDPEASESTVEMRSSLLRETCTLLGIRNVKLKNSRAMIKGHLGEYSVHLGSGVVHRMPGGSVCIVPVHSEHRGRLFLPFADDDPRTAEVVSKTLLLARDDEIDDPIILEQLRAMA